MADVLQAAMQRPPGQAERGLDLDPWSPRRQHVADPLIQIVEAGLRTRVVDAAGHMLFIAIDRRTIGPVLLISGKRGRTVLPSGRLNFMPRMRPVIPATLMKAPLAALPGMVGSTISRAVQVMCGIPEITAALPLFAQLRRYTLAVLAAAETAADFAGILYTDAPANGEADAAEPFEPIELEKRALLTMPGGWRMEQLRAEQPSTGYGEFKRSTPLAIDGDGSVNDDGTYRFNDRAASSRVVRSRSSSTGRSMKAPCSST